jgi:hypothetical protein
MIALIHILSKKSKIFVSKDNGSIREFHSHSPWVFKKIIFIIQIYCVIVGLSTISSLPGYGVPHINLGGSSFLDGGPLRQIPGWYFQIGSQNYHTDRFLNEEGKPLLGLPGPHLNSWLTSYQLIYLSDRDVFNYGKLGCDITLPVFFYSRIEENLLGITSFGSGVGDLAVGVYLQGNPIFRGERPIYVNRFEFVVSFPTGQNNLPFKTINPGNKVFYIDPYWAATLYFTPRFSASWRLHYLWVSHNHIVHFKAGDAIHANFAIEYQVAGRLYLGIAGYFLNQIKKN